MGHRRSSDSVFSERCRLVAGLFRWNYIAEITTRPAVIKELKEVLWAHDTLTFLFAVRDTGHNNAVALKEYLEKRARRTDS